MLEILISFPNSRSTSIGSFIKPLSSRLSGQFKIQLTVMKLTFKALSTSWKERGEPEQGELSWLHQPQYTESPITQLKNLHRRHQTHPNAASKLAMEEAAQLFTQEFGLPTVCLRYFNVYGPRQRPDTAYAAVIPAFIHDMINEEPPTIYGDGRQRRDFVSVDDVIRANLLAAASEAAVGSVINISGGQSVTIGELAKILQGIIPNAPAPIFGPAREGDIVNSEAVMGRAWKALGYRPEVALADGLRSTVEWFRNERLQAPE